jgi:hypothetical protein
MKNHVPSPEDVRPSAVPGDLGGVPGSPVAGWAIAAYVNVLLGAAPPSPDQLAGWSFDRDLHIDLS